MITEQQRRASTMTRILLIILIATMIAANTMDFMDWNDPDMTQSYGYIAGLLLGILINSKYRTLERLYMSKLKYEKGDKVLLRVNIVATIKNLDAECRDEYVRRPYLVRYSMGPLGEHNEWVMESELRPLTELGKAIYV